MDSSLLIDIAPAVGGHGQRGIGRYVRGLATSIAAFPDDLVERVWALGVPGATLDTFGARAIALPSPRGLSRLPLWVTGRLATDAAIRQSRAGALHATDPQRPWTSRAVPSIVTVYDLIPLRESGMIRSWRIDYQLLYRWYLRQVMSADRIVAISETTSEAIQELLGIAAERIDVVYPLVAPGARVPRVEPPEPTFLYVGALDDHKQPELALGALARFRARSGSGRLRFIGPSTALQERRLRDLAGQLGITGAISLEGRVTDDDLELAYRSTTALLATSRIEGFGLPPVEAALRGVPVIAVENPAAVETLSGVATLVPPDPEAIAEAMARPSEPQEPVLAAIRERYVLASVARSLAASYRQIL